MNYAWHEFEFSPPGVSVEHPSLRRFANITNMFTVKIKQCDLHRNKHSLIISGLCLFGCI